METEDLNFNFPNSKVNILKDVTLKINQGDKIIIDGENGSGKTTLIRILSGLLEPTSGTFFINDNTFRKVDLKQFRNQIGTIIQGESPFEGTIQENITFNDASISFDDLKWAISGVQLGGYLKTLPNGLDTRVFPEGRQLSSSNAQKILLARSIVHKPKILFYEDPTDTMDENVANEIIDFITDPKNKWIVIVSSKNPYWKTKCNRLITMKNGEIILDKKQ